MRFMVSFRRVSGRAVSGEAEGPRSAARRYRAADADETNRATREGARRTRGPGRAIVLIGGSVPLMAGQTVLVAVVGFVFAC
jgi:hypothetical protein